MVSVNELLRADRVCGSCGSFPSTVIVLDLSPAAPSTIRVRHQPWSITKKRDSLRTSSLLSTNTRNTLSVLALRCLRRALSDEPRSGMISSRRTTDEGKTCTLYQGPIRRCSVDWDIGSG